MYLVTQLPQFGVMRWSGRMLLDRLYLSIRSPRLVEQMGAPPFFIPARNGILPFSFEVDLPLLWAAQDQAVGIN
jgi:hypothetical protein